MRRPIVQPLSLMIAFAFIFCFAMPVYAADAAINVNTSTEGDGSITATVTLNGVSSVAGIQFSLDYDPSKLSLSGTEEGDLGGSCTINKENNGTVNVVWYDENGASVSNPTVLRLHFSPLSGGETSIGFGSTVPAMVVDNDLQSVTTSANGATITLPGGSSPVRSEQPEFSSAPLLPTPSATLAVITAEKTPKLIDYTETSPTPLPKQTQKPAETRVQTHEAAEPSTADIKETIETTEQPVTEPISGDTSKTPEINAENTPEAEPDGEIEVMSNTPAQTNTWMIYALVGLAAVGLAAFLLLRKKK